MNAPSACNFNETLWPVIRILSLNEDKGRTKPDNWQIIQIPQIHIFVLQKLPIKTIYILLKRYQLLPRKNS